MLKVLTLGFHIQVLIVLFVYQEKDEHLELMDGVLIDLLHAKWNAFVKFR